MCGLVGMVGMIDNKEKRAFRDLLRIDQVRGAHSVGVFSRGNHKEALFKKALSPDEMFSMRGWNDIANSQTNLYIGHNRYATQGAINGVNAHPFEQGIIIGAHNGTLRNQYLLPDSKDFEVDSKNIMHSLNIEGVEETIKNLCGAYALTWYNKEEGTINIVRNADRPLHYCWSSDRKTLFWASEDWMLYGALGRQGITFTKPLMFDVDRHYSMEVPREFPTNSKPLPKMDVVEVVPYTPPVNYHTKKKGKKGNENIYGMPIPLTMSDQLRIGDLVYFWQGWLDRDGRAITCPAETNYKYDVRIHFTKDNDLRDKLTDDNRADCMYEGRVCGSINGTDPCVIVNPATVKMVDAKKQLELLQGSMV